MLQRFAAFIVVSAVMTCSGGQTPPHASQPPAPEPMIDIDFKGGTLQRFVDLLQEAADEPINIVLAPRTRTMEIPDLTLRSATVHQALRAISSVSDSSRGHLIVDRIQASRESLPVYTVNLNPSVRRTPREAVVVVLRNLLEPSRPGAPSLNPDHVLSSIEVAAEMSEDLVPAGPDPMKIKFHPETHTLIATGNARQLALVQDLLAGLHDDLNIRRDIRLREVNIVEDVVMQRERELEELTTTRHRLSGQLRLVREKLETTRDIESPQAIQELGSIIRDLELRIDEATAGIETAEVGLAQSRAELRRLLEQEQ